MLLAGLFQHNQDNTSKAVSQLLHNLKIPVTDSTVTRTLEEHPDFPSILSISDSLKKWKVDNMAIDVDEEKFDEIPTPFIAHLRNNNFVTVVKTGNDVVSYIAENEKLISKSKQEFLKEWSHVVLAVEAMPGAGEKDFIKNKRSERIQNLKLPLAIGILLLLIAGNTIMSSLQFGAQTSALTGSLLLKFAGFFIAALLLWYEIDKNNPVIQQICQAGAKTDCNAILNSKQAKLFKWLSWSEVGFFYFAGGFLSVLFIAIPGINRGAGVLNFLAWLNLLALPYVFYSIYYQWKVAKQWCPLCLAVQLILLLELVVFYFGFWNGINFNSLFIIDNSLLTIIAAFIFPIFCWYFIKPFLFKAKEAKRYKRELNKLKHNSEIFNALKTKQKQITIEPEGLGIVLGNPAAENTIIKVCNPYCGPCAKAHPVIEKLLEENNNLKVQIILPATNEEKDARAKPVKHLMALNEKNDRQLIQQALDDWYMSEKKDYDAFAAKYALNGELNKQDENLKAMNDWCEKMKIEFTPTFFINGYQLPSIYKIEDVKYFLEK